MREVERHDRDEDECDDEHDRPPRELGLVASRGTELAGGGDAVCAPVEAGRDALAEALIRRGPANEQGEEREPDREDDRRDPRPSPGTGGERVGDRVLANEEDVDPHPKADHHEQQVERDQDVDDPVCRPARASGTGRNRSGRGDRHGDQQEQQGGNADQRATS